MTYRSAVEAAYAAWKRAEADADYEKQNAWEAARKAKALRDKWRALKAAVKAEMDKG